MMLVLTAVVACVLSVQVQAVSDQPNILFIMLDDWRDSINVGKDHPVKRYDMTPNIFKLKEKSLNFERAYAQYPQCLPSRSSILTGWYPRQLQHYNYLNDPFKDNLNTSHLFEESIGTSNLPKHFKDNGYQVGVTGKIFHVQVTKYDAHRDWTTVAKDYTFDYNVCKKGINCVCEETMEPEAVDIPCYDYLTMRHAKQMIADFSVVDKPWLVMAGFIRPHGTYTYSKATKDLLKLRMKRKKNYFKKDAREPSNKKLPNIARISVGRFQCKSGRLTMLCKKYYYMSLMTIDTYIGQLLDQVRDSGQENNTAIVLTSDHGFSLGENSHYGKWVLFESTLRVPLLIHSPRHAASRGLTTPAQTELVDLFPTLTALAGLDAPARPTLSGQSLLPLLVDPGAEVKQHTTALVMRCDIRGGKGRDHCATRTRGSLDVSVMGHFMSAPGYNYIEWRKVLNLPQCLKKKTQQDCLADQYCVWQNDSPKNEPLCLAEGGLQAIDWSSKGLVSKEYYSMNDRFSNVAKVKKHQTEVAAAAVELKLLLTSIGS